MPQRAPGVLAVVVLAAAFSGCGSSESHSGHSVRPPCDAHAGLLLATRLSRLQDSPAFQVPPHVIAWAMTTGHADPEALFGDLGGVLDVAVRASDRPARVRVDAQGNEQTGDAMVNLRKSGEWYRLPVGAGTWRIYTIDLGVSNYPVTVIGCRQRG